jgi:hypothetical protein
VRGAALTLFAWAAINAVILVPMPTIFHENAVPTLSYVAAVAGTAAVGAVCWVWQRRAPAEDPDAVRLVTDVSFASALAGAAVALMLLGVAFGVWITQIGAGLFVLGVAGVVRELRAERRQRAL